MRSSWTGAPEESPGQHVLFIQSPDTFPSYEKTWSGKQDLPMLLEGIVEEEDWREFSGHLAVLVSRYWHDALWMMWGGPGVVVLFTCFWFMGFDTDACSLVTVMGLFAWMCVVWTLKWSNAGVDGEIEDLVEGLCGKLPADVAEVKYDYAWTELLRPMAAREWRAIIISRKDREGEKLAAQIYGYGLA